MHPLKYRNAIYIHTHTERDLSSSNELTPFLPSFLSSSNLGHSYNLRTNLAIAIIIMSPTPFHPKREIHTTTSDNNNHNHNQNHALCPPPLKIHKDSHSIKKSTSPPPSMASSSSSSSSSASSSLVNGVIGANKPQQRHPVIIYTHSPKVIHTHPRDFMALVQKLTGLSKSDNNNDGAAADPPPPQTKPEQGNGSSEKKVCANEDNETSSVITEENNCSSSVGDTTQVNSCFLTNPVPMMDPPPPPPPLNPYMAANLPVFTTPPNSAELFCSSNQPFLNYDSLLFSHNMRTSMNNPSATTLEGMNDFRDF